MTTNSPIDQVESTMDVEDHVSHHRPHDHEWHEHEHTTAAAQIQAEILLEATGSARIGKNTPLMWQHIKIMNPMQKR